MHRVRARRWLASRSRLPSGPAGGRLLVLVVDDDPDSRVIYRTILRASGYAVMTTGDGSEAVRLATERSPDIILMDLDVPGTDGLIATRILREQEATAAIPVLAVTGHVFPEYEMRAREAGCVGFLGKPILPNDVVAEIRRILSPSSRVGR
jgi:two-component system, cell cycle response regulator DivK